MKQIIAMGGGRFSNGEHNALLEDYVLVTSGVSNPSICFLPTASGDAPDYIVSFYSAFSQHNCRPSHLPLIQPAVANLEAEIAKHDILLIGGGNTKNMLALWRGWGLDALIQDAYQRGTLLAGWSAGAICWFEQGVTDSIPGKLTALDCLGMLTGSCCPHYDGERARRAAYQRLIKKEGMPAGIALDDATAAHYVDGKLHRLVGARPQAAAYQVGMQDGQVLETRLAADYLG
ncbi:MAG: peptidase E [Anaerolineales bacterium]|nr:peptidase E [Anaerolineales bacterium]